MSEGKGPKPNDHIATLTTYSVPGAKAPMDVFLNLNEGQPPPIELLEKIAKRGPEMFSRYPNNSVLEKMIARHYDVDEKQVLVTAGGDDSIDRLCTAYLGPEREMLITNPAFPMYDKFAKLVQGKVRYVPWHKGPLPVQEILDSVTDRIKVIVLVTPGNPTGSTAFAQDLIAIAKGAPDCLIYLDHAYAPFTDHDLTTTALTLPNVITLHSFSKGFGMAGLRVAYTIGPEEIIYWLRCSGPPFPISQVSLALAESWFEDGREYSDKYIQKIIGERERLHAHLTALGAAPYESQTNFVFAHFDDPLLVRDLISGLGIAVRPFFRQTEFGPGVRITCPARDDHFERLTHTLSCALAPQAILFDMDGVLADDSRSYRAAVVETAATFGLTLTEKQVNAAKDAGNANNEWILTQRLLAEAGIEADLAEVTKRFEEIYQGTADRKGLWTTETLIPEAETLRKIAAKIPVAIVTGRPRADALRFLEVYGIADLFPVVVCMEDGPLKPDPTPVRIALEQLGIDHAWMIGDTPDDLVAARKAGVIPIGVIAPGQDPEAAGEAMIASGGARILDRIDQLLEWIP